MGKRDSDTYVESLRFAGHTTGLVKTLRGFKKGQHTLPDAINPATTAFLARLCSAELAEEAEELFQRAKTLCGYKRKDLALDIGAGQAVLTAKDFTLEIAYGFDDEPAGYRTQWALEGAKDLDFLKGTACTELFAGRFGELVFALTKGAPVEAVIDAIEELDGESPLHVDYPSDCRHCTISVPDVEATVRFDGAELAMQFPRAGAPADLLDAFQSVRSAFNLAKSKSLAALLR